MNRSEGFELFRKVRNALRSLRIASEGKEGVKEGKYPSKRSEGLLGPLKCVFGYSDSFEKVRCNDFHGVDFQV